MMMVVVVVVVVVVVMVCADSIISSGVDIHWRLMRLNISWSCYRHTGDQQ